MPRNYTKHGLLEVKAIFLLPHMELLWFTLAVLIIHGAFQLQSLESRSPAGWFSRKFWNQ